MRRESPPSASREAAACSAGGRERGGAGGKCVRERDNNRKRKGGREGGREGRRRRGNHLLTQRVEEGSGGITLHLGRLLLQRRRLDDEEGVDPIPPEGELAPERREEGMEGGKGGVESMSMRSSAFLPPFHPSFRLWPSSLPPFHPSVSPFILPSVPPPLPPSFPFIHSGAWTYFCLVLTCCSADSSGTKG